MERVEMEREKRSHKSRQMLNLRETICFFFFSLVFHFLASPFLAFLIYRWSLCLSTHLLIRWHEYHILEGFWLWKTFHCSNFKLFESWSNLLSCLRRRFYSIISFDLVMRNLNFRISEFQSCFSKASGIWAILQSRGRSWKKSGIFRAQSSLPTSEKFYENSGRKYCHYLMVKRLFGENPNEFDVFGSINRSILVLCCESSDWNVCSM